MEGNIDHTDETFFKDIYQLSSGSLISIDNIRLTFKKFKWYEKYLYIDESDIKYLDAKDQLDLLLRNIVNQNIESDIPIAINISESINSELLEIISKKISLILQKLDIG